MLYFKYLNAFSDTPAPIKGLVTPRNIDVDLTFYFLSCFVYLGYRGLTKQATYAFPVILCCNRCVVKTRGRGKRSITLKAKWREEVERRMTSWVTSRAIRDSRTALFQFLFSLKTREFWFFNFLFCGNPGDTLCKTSEMTKCSFLLRC